MAGDRLAEQKALHEVDASRHQEAMLVLAFHALRHDLEAEGPPDADDRVNDGRVHGGVEVGDEAAINLDAPERKASQGGQTRVAGAEIVEREGDAARVELLDGTEARVLRLQERAFRDLEPDPARLDARLRDDPLDPVAEPRPRKLNRRQIDGDVEVGP